ncbi:hypothetical protein AAG906_023735 [Vitis piasezkii]
MARVPVLHFATGALSRLMECFEIRQLFKAQMLAESCCELDVAMADLRIMEEHC